jgi:hypothetical protein
LAILVSLALLVVLFLFDGAAARTASRQLAHNGDLPVARRGAFG